MKQYRNDFPMLKQKYIYFNNAATSYKPYVVIKAIKKYYEEYSVNISRGVDSLSYGVTQKYEEARKTVANFINANENEIVFTRGTTDSLNLVARSFGEIINAGDEVIVSIHEHHANFIPWQELCKRKQAKLIIVDTDIDGTVNLEDLNKKLNDKTKIVALYHTSNVFGGTNNLKQIAKSVHKNNAYLVVDGAQGIVHHKVDVKEMDIDFYVFSGHKMYGPMGVGVLYGKYELLKQMYPITFGGEMIDIVTFINTTYKKPPYAFEAGTMMIPEVLGLKVAIDYINSIGQDNIKKTVGELRNYLLNNLKKINDIIIYNEKVIDTNLITFNIKNIHAHDIASLLDKENIIVRAGHHCASPLMDHLKVTGTIRISLAFYNTKEECDKLVEVLMKAGDYINVLF